SIKYCLARSLIVPPPTRLIAAAAKTNFGESFVVPSPSAPNCSPRTDPPLAGISSIQQPVIAVGCTCMPSSALAQFDPDHVYCPAPPSPAVEKPLRMTRPPERPFS